MELPGGGDEWLAPSPSPPGPSVPDQHDDHRMGTFIWPPMGTSTWPPVGTFSWPWQGSLSTDFGKRRHESEVIQQTHQRNLRSEIRDLRLTVAPWGRGMMSTTLRRGWALLRVDGPVEASRAVFRKLARLSQSPHEVSETDFVAEALLSRRRHRSNGVMMDVGAHHGAVFAEFAKHGWQVCAFEPDRKNRERITAAFGRLNNVIIDDRAVSDVSANEVAFFVSTQSSGISSLSAFDESHNQAGVVTTVTIDDFTVAKEIHEIDYLKIDTEGYDLMVLKGFPWDRMRPTVIICEFENRKTVPLGYNFRDLADFLSAKGYQSIVSEWFPITSYGRKHRWRRYATYPCDLADDSGWGNLIASNDSELLANVLKRFEAVPPPA
jgi:FkbM family methyltransferase